MTALVVCVSMSEGNTRHVAEAIGEALGATVVEPEDIAPNDVVGYELLGLGSGIYGWMFHARLWRFARSLPRVQGTPVFLFATSGGPELLWRPARVVLSRLLRSKGYRVLGMFSCPGFDNLGPFQLVGGLNKGRPNEADLAEARAFASGLDKQRKGAGDTRVRPAPGSRGRVGRPSASSSASEQVAS